VVACVHIGTPKADVPGNVYLLAEAKGAVELLLAVGADMDAARLDGMTAIHLAQLPGTPKAIYELMMLGQEEALE